MDIRDRRGLKAAADEALTCAPDHRKLVLVSTGAVAVVSLLVSFLNLLLAEQIAGTGGLAGMGLRSVLSTVQSVLSMALSIALPFWALGYTAAVLKLARREQATIDVLLTGFRRFFPVLRLLLLKGVLYCALCMVCIYVGCMVLAMTPLALPLYELLLPLMEASSEQAMLEAFYAIDQNALTQAMLPMLLLSGVVCIVVCIPVSYRLRMADLRMMDEEKCGALAAMLTSNRMMKGNCVALFKLDLSFWWFYLGELLVAVLAWCDVLLPMLGITLPMSEEGVYFLFYALALGLQVALYAFARNRVEVTYATVYDALLPKEQ